MGRPGILGVRSGTRGSGQLAFANFNSDIIAKSLADALKNGNNNNNNNSNAKVAKKRKSPIFDSNGHVSLESISERREFFLGKSIARIEHELHKNGYTTERKKSNHVGSKAKITIVINSSKERNIGQIQVSPGSKRHGDVPYVKISTKDIGKIKIIGATESQYKTDGKEKATLLFRRYR